MKDLLLTSTLPYWVVSSLMASAGFIAIVNMRRKSISRLSVQLVTFLAIIGTAFGLVIYSLLGSKSIWWCTSSDYGFPGKQLLVIPLIVFVGIRLVQVFVYKAFVGQYFQKELSIKGTFVSLIVIVPATLVLYVILDMFGLEKEIKDIVAYGILGLAFVVGVGWAMVRNGKSIGMMYGLMFTAAALVMIIGGLMSKLLLLMALLALILQVLMVASVVSGVFYMFKTDMLGGSSGGVLPISFFMIMKVTCTIPICPKKKQTEKYKNGISKPITVFYPESVLASPTADSYV